MHFSSLPGSPVRRLLLVDDDVELGRMLREYLEPDHYQVALAHTGAQAAPLFEGDKFDLALLDLMLPDVSGLELLKRHRARSRRPIIMFTAHGGETDRVLGLEFGADDYLAKPFSPRELKARIGAVLRRFDPYQAGGSALMELGNLSLNPLSGSATFDGQPVALTGAELRVLEILMRSAGEVVERDRIGQFALGRVPDRYDRSIDTHVSALRRKLQLDGAGRKLEIRNLRGRGYLLALLP